MKLIICHILSQIARSMGFRLCIKITNRALLYEIIILKTDDTPCSNCRFYTRFFQSIWKLFHVIWKSVEFTSNLVRIVYFTCGFVYTSYGICRWVDTTGHLCWSAFYAQITHWLILNDYSFAGDNLFMYCDLKRFFGEIHTKFSRFNMFQPVFSQNDNK